MTTSNSPNLFSFPEFQDWKSFIEGRECCTFISLRGKGIIKGEKIEYWQCNRSGLYKPKRKKRRRSKNSGLMFFKYQYIKIIKFIEFIILRDLVWLF